MATRGKITGKTYSRSIYFYKITALDHRGHIMGTAAMIRHDSTNLSPEVSFNFNKGIVRR
jgi:hypothetical protein